MIAIAVDGVTVASVNVTQSSKARVFRLRTVNPSAFVGLQCCCLYMEYFKDVVPILTSLLKVML